MVKSSQQGFTLIELVVVIVILGILAAFAVPRFMGMETEARIAATKSMAGTLRSAVAMAHGVCVARGCTNAAVNLNLNGRTVQFVNQYPTNATVRNLIESTEGFTPPGATPNRFTKSGTRNPAACWVEYQAPAAAGAQPTIVYPAGRIQQPGVGGGVTEAMVDNGLRANC